MRTRTFVLDSRTRTPGEYLSPVTLVPASATYIGVAIDRTLLPSLGGAEVLACFVEVSTDGVMWRLIGGVTTSSKVVLTKQGIPATETACLLRLYNNPGGLQARARVQYTVDCAAAVSLLYDDAPLPIREAAHRSVSYDNDLENTATAATSVTIASFAVANNANRHMIVGVASWDSVAADLRVSTVTFNGSGTGWSELGIAGGGAGQNTAALWGKTAPDVATASVVITMGGTCAEIGANALSSFGVDQTTPTGTVATIIEDPFPTSSMDVASAVGDLVYDVGYVSDALLPTVGAGQTQRANSVITGNARRLASTEPGAAGTTNMSWSYSENELTSAGVAIKAAGGVAPHGLLLLGVGI